MRTLACLLAGAYSNDESVVIRSLQQCEQLISSHAHLFPSKCINAVVFYLTDLFPQVVSCFTENAYELLCRVVSLILENCWFALDTFEVCQLVSNAFSVVSKSRFSHGFLQKVFGIVRKRSLDTPPLPSKRLSTALDVPQEILREIIDNAAIVCCNQREVNLTISLGIISQHKHNTASISNNFG
jgi:hypothetical protein